VMSSTFRLARGVAVADLSGIHEGYSVEAAPRGHAVFTVNVSAERMRTVFERLASEVSDPGFLVLEVGTHESVEKTLRKSSTDPFHKDVYYLDALSHEGLREILDRHGDLLTHDGGIHFGFGGSGGIDEVYVGPYKILHIYANAPEKYVRALQDLGFVGEPRLKTVWDNFTAEAPGKRMVLTDVKTTIWSLIEELKTQGLYFAERRDA
jgi:hypothetical protein